MADIDNDRTLSNDSDSLAIDHLLDNSHESATVNDSDRDSDALSLDLGPCRNPSGRAVANQNNHPIRYAFSQLFGELVDDPTSVVTNADMISAVRFNSTSDMIAAGDKGGRLVLLKRLSASEERDRRERPRYGISDNKLPPVGGSFLNCEFEQSHYDDDHRDDSEAMPERPLFDFWTQFQSHHKELDYLRNLDIVEKINQICWCRPVSGTQRLLVSNEKTIKLWRVFEKDIRRLVSVKPTSVPSRDGTPLPLSRPLGRPIQRPRSPQSPHSPGSEPKHTSRRFPLHNSSLKIPRFEVKAKTVSSTPKRIFRSYYYYHINSISLSSDEEIFLSADDLRINLWNLHRNASGFNILDVHPNTLNGLSEVITGAEFHPQHCSIFAYTNTQAMTKLCDLRESAICRKWVRKFEEAEPTSNQTSFFAEIIASISDVKFSPDGQSIMTRDYMNVRLWDLRMERAPVLVVPVHEHLRPRLCDLYQNDCIFDKFQCRFSGDGGSLLTGSYNSLFQAFSSFDGSCSAVEASIETVTGWSGRQNYSAEGLSASLLANSSVQELVEPTSRIMCLDASPQEEIAAVAAGPAIYFYYGMKR